MELPSELSASSGEEQPWTLTMPKRRTRRLDDNNVIVIPVNRHVTIDYYNRGSNPVF